METMKQEIGNYLLTMGKKDEYRRFMMIDMAYRFLHFLDSKGIHYDRCVKHKKVVGCFESSKYYKRFEEYLGDTYTICKNLLVQERKGEKRKFLIITDSKKRVNLSDLKEQMDTKKLEFVGEEDMKSLLHTTPGNVSLFNVISDKEKKVNIVIDEELLSKEELAFHPLYNEMSVFLKPQECLKFLKVIGRTATILPIREKELPLQKTLVS